jgi:hypothetical protein
VQSSNTTIWKRDHELCIVTTEGGLDLKVTQKAVCLGCIAKYDGGMTEGRREGSALTQRAMLNGGSEKGRG